MISGNFCNCFLMSCTYTVQFCSDQVFFFFYVIQVVLSSLLFREDIDIGTGMVGDLHKRAKSCKCRLQRCKKDLCS